MHDGRKQAEKPPPVVSEAVAGPRTPYLDRRTWGEGGAGSTGVGAALRG